MPLNVVLIAQRQSPEGIALSWTSTEGVAAYQIFVSSRKLSPEELEAAALLGGTDDCFVAKVGAEVTSVVDDITPQGEARHYGVAMLFDDGALKAARFKAVPDGGAADSFHLSMVKMRMTTGSYRIKPPPGAAGAGKPIEAPPAVKVMAPPARTAAPAPAASAPAASAEPPRPPSSVPLEEPIDLRMQGATQTWDGLRIYWDADPRAAAYEIIASDHQIFGDELADALAGKADFTTAVAVAPDVSCVLDNTTPREARGWYAVLVRYRDGRRVAHPFKVGDAATSGRTSGPFLNPNRTGELRAEVEGLLADAREQWGRWKSDQDGGARREARRLVGDALLIWPDHPAAKKLQAELA